MVETEPEVVPFYPASPVAVQTALEEVSPVTIVDIEMFLLRDGGSCANTATSQTGRAGEEEWHTGIQGTREEAHPGGGQEHPGLAHGVATT